MQDSTSLFSVTTSEVQKFFSSVWGRGTSLWGEAEHHKSLYLPHGSFQGSSQCILLTSRHLGDPFCNSIHSSGKISSGLCSSSGIYVPKFYLLSHVETTGRSMSSSLARGECRVFGILNALEGWFCAHHSPVHSISYTFVEFTPMQAVHALKHPSLHCLWEWSKDKLPPFPSYPDLIFTE